MVEEIILMVQWKSFKITREHASTEKHEQLNKSKLSGKLGIFVNAETSLQTLHLSVVAPVKTMQFILPEIMSYN